MLDPVAFWRCKAATPGILGMNILSKCYYILFEQHGSNLFYSPLVHSAALLLQRALRYCEKVEAIVNSAAAFPVKVQGSIPVRITAGTLAMVPETCPLLPLIGFLLEPLGLEDGALPEGLLVSPTLVKAKQGTLYAPITNVSSLDVWLPPQRIVDTVQVVDVSYVTDM